MSRFDAACVLFDHFGLGADAGNHGGLADDRGHGPFSLSCSDLAAGIEPSVSRSWPILLFQEVRTAHGGGIIRSRHKAEGTQKHKAEGTSHKQRKNSESFDNLDTRGDSFVSFAV